MFNLKIIISIIIFSSLLVATSTIKNQTRVIEKKIFNLNSIISNKEKDFKESQLDFSYLTSPSMIEQKIEHLFVKQNEKQLTLVVHPYLYSYFTIGVLSRQYKWFIKHRRWVRIESDGNIGIKDYVFLDSNGQIIQTKK